MSADIAKVWETIQILANNFHNNGERGICTEFDWNSSVNTFEAICVEFEPFYEGILAYNTDARLIRYINGLCMLIEFSGLCFRIGVQMNFEGVFHGFIDFKEDATYYPEFHLAHTYDELSGADTDEEWPWF